MPSLFDSGCAIAQSNGAAMYCVASSRLRRLASQFRSDWYISPLYHYGNTKRSFSLVRRGGVCQSSENAETDDVAKALGPFRDAHATLEQVKKLSWNLQDHIVYLQDLATALHHMQCMYNSLYWGFQLQNSVLMPSQRRLELFGERMQQEEDLKKKPQWYCNDEQRDFLNKLIKDGVDSYVPLPPLRRSGVAEYEKQLQESRDAADSKPVIPDVKPTGLFNPSAPIDESGESFEMQYERMKRENNQWRDRGDWQEGRHNPYTPRRPEMSYDNVGSRGRYRGYPPTPQPRPGRPGWVRDERSRSPAARRRRRADSSYN